MILLKTKDNRGKIIKNL